MNKRKILTLAMALCMVAILAVGGTLAYFTDADKDINVMTTGSVKIVQNETDRNGDAYKDGQKLYPAVYLDEQGNPYNPTASWEGPKTLEEFASPDGTTMKMYTSINNEIDKVVSVTNTGDVDAYVRTIVLFENTDDLCKGNLHVNYSSAIGHTNKVIKVGEQEYYAWIFTYKNALEPNATTMPSIKQVWLNPLTDSDWYKKLGEDQKLTIIALSQAAQTEGFTSAEQALNTAFGEVNDANVTKWLEETNIKTSGVNNVVDGELDSESEETNP